MRCERRGQLLKTEPVESLKVEPPVYDMVYPA